MNKKIILSLSVIGIVAAIAIGGTVAYFSDTEASTGNILVAGSLDLKVDHTKQTYNTIDCKTCTVGIKSDTTNSVTGMVGGNDPVSFPHNAVLVTNINPAWTANIPSANWIWSQDPTPEAEKGIDTIYTFEKTFIWYGPIIGATLQLSIGTDNSYEIFLNNNWVAGDNTEQNYNAAGQDTITGTPISNQIVQGVNTLRFVVKNWARPQGQTWDNPGGLLYKLEINGNCGDNYFKQNCRLWGLKDLTADDKFFNFEDVKPGDSGTNVISLHVYNNDAWVCMSTDNVVNEEVTLTEPELEMVPADDANTGELGKNINIFMWRDTNNDGIYDSGESSLGSYTLEVNSIIPLYDSQTLGGLPLVGSNTVYVGLAWCAGTQSVVGNTISCDGAGMNNYSQSDKVTADLIFRAEQARNQDTFICPM
jgi:predicted ribosomally synthesized peptide with SipW-like signal peptide